MTKKDYIFIAKIINDLKFASSLPVQEIAYRFAADLGKDNPKFDGERFLEACIVEKKDD